MKSDRALVFAVIRGNHFKRVPLAVGPGPDAANPSEFGPQWPSTINSVECRHRKGQCGAKSEGTTPLQAEVSPLSNPSSKTSQRSDTIASATSKMTTVAALPTIVVM